jgi:hypothetical protein
MLFDAEFCNPASGWEKGMVEKNVQDRRRQVRREAAERRWADLEALNTWQDERCRQSWEPTPTPNLWLLDALLDFHDDHFWQVQLSPLTEHGSCGTPSASWGGRSFASGQAPAWPR